MAVSFINPKNSVRFMDVLNTDPEFKIAARYMTKDVMLEVGSDKCIVKFRDGDITQIKSEDAFADPWDFAIRASSDAWEKFLMPIPPRFYDGLFGGMIRGNFSIEGDTIGCFGHLWAITRMLDVFRELQNKKQFEGV